MMTRWLPDARGRLTVAAIALYGERGFEQTTVAEIAERAGVTERTFYRHFSDKREVLFGGSGALQATVIGAIEAAPPGRAPIDVMGDAMASAAALMQPGRDHSRGRAAVIEANPSLQERELLKLATLSAASAEALRGRGVPTLAAAVAAEAGVTVFKLGFERWIADSAADTAGDAVGDAAGVAANSGEAPDFARCIREALDELKALTNPSR